MIEDGGYYTNFELGQVNNEVNKENCDKLWDLSIETLRGQVLDINFFKKITLELIIFI